MTPVKESAGRRAASRGGARRAATRSHAKAAKAPFGSIRHLVVLMLENRSFDHILGCLASIYPGMVGIDADHPRSNLDDAGGTHPQRPGAGATVKPGPAHDHDDVVDQIADANSGFVRNYQHSAKAPQAGLGAVMDYHDLGTLPAIHALARNFTICDHWFSSVPGPTWTNRFFAHSGTSRGLVEMPHFPFHWNLRDYDQVTPGAAVPPDAHHEEYGFDQYGVRVPALLISPWVGRGVASTVFDHTSVLHYATELWGLEPLGARVAAANSVGVVINSAGPRKDTPATVPAEALPKVSRDLVRRPPKLNDHQKALIGFSEYLETLIDAPPKTRDMRSAKTFRSPMDSVEVAKSRVRLFLEQQRRRARR